MKLGIFVDTTNLYHTVYRKHNGRLCYEEYYQQVENDNEVIEANAYGMTIGNTDSFASCLSYAGFATRFKAPKIIEIHDVKIKRCDWGIQMTVDIFGIINKVDVIIPESEILILQLSCRKLLSFFLSLFNSLNYFFQISKSFKY